MIIHSIIIITQYHTMHNNINNTLYSNYDYNNTKLYDSDNNNNALYYNNNNTL